MYGCNTSQICQTSIQTFFPFTFNLISLLHITIRPTPDSGCLLYSAPSHYLPFSLIWVYPLTSAVFIPDSNPHPDSFDQFILDPQFRYITNLSTQHLLVP